MKFDQTKYLEAGGALAIILSLVFVALQIQQANRIAMGTAESELRAQAMEHQRYVASPEMAPLMARLQSAETELDAEEKIRARALSRMYIQLLISVEAAYKNGLVSSNTLDIFLNTLELSNDEVPGLWPYYVGLAEFADGSYPSAVYDKILEVSRSD